MVSESFFTKGTQITKLKGGERREMNEAATYNMILKTKRTK